MLSQEPPTSPPTPFPQCQGLLRGRQAQPVLCSQGWDRNTALCCPRDTPLHSCVWLQGVTAHPDLSQPALRSSVPSCHTGVVAVSWGHLSGTPELLLDTVSVDHSPAAAINTTAQQHSILHCPPSSPMGSSREGPHRTQHGRDRRMRLEKPLPKHQHRHPAQPGCCSSPSQCSNWAVSPSARFCSSYRNCRAI